MFPHAQTQRGTAGGRDQRELEVRENHPSLQARTWQKRGCLATDILQQQLYKETASFSLFVRSYQLRRPFRTFCINKPYNKDITDLYTILMELSLEAPQFLLSARAKGKPWRNAQPSISPNRARDPRAAGRGWTAGGGCCGPGELICKYSHVGLTALLSFAPFWCYFNVDLHSWYQTLYIWTACKDDTINPQLYSQNLLFVSI